MTSPTDPVPGLGPAQRPSRGRQWLVGAVAVAAALAFALLWIWRLAVQDLPEVPSAQALWSFNRPADVVFVDDQGAWIGERPGHRGAPLKLGVLPSHVVNAFLAAQDQDFERHGGVDLGAILHAEKADMSTGRWTRGGSTVTQQLARDLFDLKGPPLRRKAQESVIA
ncbi:MAG: transglycosylase domain-containing protein, partial [Caulobacteraceae bacterium]